MAAGDRQAGRQTVDGAAGNADLRHPGQPAMGAQAQDAVALDGSQPTAARRVLAPQTALSAGTGSCPAAANGACAPRASRRASVGPVALDSGNLRAQIDVARDIVGEPRVAALDPVLEGQPRLGRLDRALSAGPIGQMPPGAMISPLECPISAFSRSTIGCNASLASGSARQRRRPPRSVGSAMPAGPPRRA